MTRHGPGSHRHDDSPPEPPAAEAEGGGARRADYRQPSSRRQPDVEAEALDVPVIVAKPAVSAKPADDVEVLPEVKAFVSRMMRLTAQEEEAPVWELTFQGRVPRSDRDGQRGAQ